jgi:hypothetical protein
LCVIAKLGVRFKTANLVENLLLQLERKTQRAAGWRTSYQNLRWGAAPLLELEPRPRRIKGCDQLPLCRPHNATNWHLARPAVA